MFKVSSILSILTLTGTLIAIAAIFKIFKKIVKDPEYTQNLTFEKRFGVLTEGIKTNVTYKRGLIMTQKGFYLGRWIITVGIMILFKDQSLLQIGSLLLISVITQCILIAGQPFID